MSIARRIPTLVLLLSCSHAAARAEVLVRWDLDQVPARDSLGIPALVVPAARSAALQDAVAKGYRVYLEVGATEVSELEVPSTAVAGVVVRGAIAADQLGSLRERLRPAGVRVLAIDDRGLWPHVRLNWVTLRNNVLQVSSRTAQPWLDSNAVFPRITPARPGEPPLLLSPAWEPITVAETHQGPALENYLVAIAEAGSFGHDLVLPLHEGFQRDLLLGKPAARADWQQIRRHLEFYSWDLPQHYRRVSNIAVMAADPMGSVEILRLLTRHNLPFELLAPGALQPETLRRFTLVIVLDPLKQAEIQSLAAFAASGATVVFNGPPPAFKWEGAVQIVKTERHVSYQVGKGRVLERLDPIADPDEFARDVRDVLGPDGRVVDVWNGITVLVAPFEDSTGDTVLVTAVNFAHEAQPIQVRVLGRFSQAYYESTESEPALLPLRQRNGHAEFVLPALRVGGRVFLRREREPR
jgi:hypothetical protein